MGEAERILFEIDGRNGWQVGVAAKAREHVGLDNRHAAGRFNEGGIEALELCRDGAWDHLLAARLAEAVEVHFDAREIRESTHACQLVRDVVRIGVQKVARSGQKPRGVQTRANHVDHHFRAVVVGAQLVGGVVEGGKGIDLAGLGACAAHAHEVVSEE